MVPKFRGFNLSERVSCEKASSKPFSWVKDIEMPAKSIRRLWLRVSGLFMTRLELFHKPWPNFYKAFNTEDKRHSRAEKDSILIQC